jgi:3D (Asp-Asp-Asp) domain-containing protein/peptidoglycan hydrolase CwlO-like protein
MRGQAPRLRLAGAALIVVAVTLAPAAAGDPSQQLKDRDAALAAKSRAAVLSLYAIESRLVRARTSLTSIQAKAETLRRERALVQLQLHVAKRGVRLSQSRLANRLRALYERGDIDPLAIVLGADSLDTALTGLESLGQMANGDHAVVEQVRGARHSLVGLKVRLADRQHKLDGLVAAAAATARSLESTRASRAAYVGQLATQRRLNEAAIARLEEQAQAAQLKAQTLELASAAPVPVPAPTAAPGSEPVPAPEPTPAAPAVPAVGGRAITVTATGYALPGTTATGLPVGWGVAAVDPSVIPLGTHFTVPGYGEAVAADIGSAVHGATIDLWFPTAGQAQGWGRRTVTIVLH